MTTTAVATITESSKEIQSSDLMLNTNSFEQLQRIGTMFANSGLVPAHLRGKVADCTLAYYMAMRMGEDPIIVMQNIVSINGTAGWKTQYMIGRANRSGVLKNRIDWRSEGKGDLLKVTAFATLAATGTEISVSADMAMAKTEGWTKNTKYQSMPEHMLKWRSASMLIRLHCPEVMFGMYTADELETITIDAKEIPPHRLEPRKPGLEKLDQFVQEQAIEGEGIAQQATDAGKPDSAAPHQVGD